MVNVIHRVVLWCTNIKDWLVWQRFEELQKLADYAVDLWAPLSSNFTSLDLGWNSEKGRCGMEEDRKKREE